MIVYLRRRQLLLCSFAHINIPLRLPLRNVIRKFGIHRRSTVASVPLLPAKAREGRGRGCCCGAVLWPPWYLWSQPKLEKGREPGCCCGAVLWPPLYPWSQPKLEKGRGPDCYCGTVLWPPLYLWSQPKLEKGRGAGCCCGDNAVPSPPL